MSDIASLITCMSHPASVHTHVWQYASYTYICMYMYMYMYINEVELAISKVACIYHFSWYRMYIYMCKESVDLVKRDM